jgi:hypothetical protein
MALQITMKQYISILLLTFPGSAIAESYLCIAEEAAGVRDYLEIDKKEALIFDVSKRKWIIKKSEMRGWEGKWQLFEFGDDFPTFINCDSKIHTSFNCHNASTDEHFQFFSDHGSYNAFTWNDSKTYREYVVELGRCTKI